MLCEVKNCAIRVGGVKYPVGTIREFPDELVKLRPDILFPLSKNKEEDNEMKTKLLSIQDKVKKLEDENINLVFKLKESEKTNERLTKMIREKIDTIDKLEKNARANTVKRGRPPIKKKK